MIMLIQADKLIKLYQIFIVNEILAICSVMFVLVTLILMLKE